MCSTVIREGPPERVTLLRVENMIELREKGLRLGVEGLVWRKVRVLIA